MMRLSAVSKVHSSGVSKVELQSLNVIVMMLEKDSFYKKRKYVDCKIGIYDINNSRGLLIKGAYILLICEVIDGQ